MRQPIATLYPEPAAVVAHRLRAQGFRLLAEAEDALAADAPAPVAISVATPAPEWVTPKYVAACTGLSRSQVYELCQTGELASVTVGRARRIPHAALTRWMRAHGGS